MGLHGLKNSVISLQDYSTHSLLTDSVHLAFCWDFLFIWSLFVQDDKYRSIWVLLHTKIQTDQYDLLKMVSFIHLYFWTIYQKLGVHDLCLGLQFVSTELCVSLQTLCSFHFHSSVVQFEIRYGNSSSSYIVTQGCVSYICFT